MNIKQLFYRDGIHHHLLKDAIRNILMKPKYKSFVRWYQKNFKHDIENIKMDYYIHLEQIQKILHFKNENEII